MSQAETEKRETLKQAVNRLVFPAVNVLRGIELDLQEHSSCPYRDLAKTAVTNLMELMEIVNGPKVLPPDR